MYIAAIVASAILYRMGGGDKWNTKVRDMGIPLVCLLAFYPLLPAPLWIYLVTFILFFGSLCTYFDHWGTDDVEWFEWALVGFVTALTAIQLVMHTGNWLGLLIRVVVNTILVWGWSVYHDDVEWEERGRGAIISGTLLLILIGG